MTENLLFRIIAAAKKSNFMIIKPIPKKKTLEKHEDIEHRIRNKLLKKNRF